MTTLEEIKNLQIQWTALFKSLAETNTRSVKGNTAVVLSALGILKGKIFDIDALLIHMLELTDNSPHETRLPFPCMFIPNIFSYKGTIMRGIVLIELPDAYPILKSIRKDLVVNDDSETQLHRIIAFTMLQQKTAVSMVANEICEVVHGFHVIKSPDVSMSSEDFSTAKETKNNMVTFCLNLCDFIHDPDVTYVDRRFAKYELRKYGTGQTPIVKKILVHGRLKRYLYQLREHNTFRYSHRFWVRGHFRHLRSKRFKNKIGSTIWIYPYVKGEGILIEKPYNLRV